jgi:DNA-binding NarL/FixJ family response regulator
MSPTCCARGFEVIAETDRAVTAVAVAAALAPDAVLLDVRRGADDGYSVCRALMAAAATADGW